jgi:hypothetical protein
LSSRPTHWPADRDDPGAIKRCNRTVISKCFIVNLQTEGMFGGVRIGRFPMFYPVLILNAVFLAAMAVLVGPAVLQMLGIH